MKIELPEINDSARELLADPRPISEAAMEHADSSENVIYTYKAHKNVANATQDEREYADTILEDTGGVSAHYSADIYDRTATLLSFWIEENRYMESVRGELGELRDALEAAQSDIAEALEALETILD